MKKIDLTREEVLKRAIIQAALILLAILVRAGWVAPELQSGIAAYVPDVAALAAGVIIAYLEIQKRANVTPTADPRDSEGRPLTPGG